MYVRVVDRDDYLIIQVCSVRNNFKIRWFYPLMQPKLCALFSGVQPTVILVGLYFIVTEIYLPTNKIGHIITIIRLTMQ